MRNGDLGGGKLWILLWREGVVGVTDFLRLGGVWTGETGVGGGVATDGAEDGPEIGAFR